MNYRKIAILSIIYMMLCTSINASLLSDPELDVALQLPNSEGLLSDKIIALANKYYALPYPGDPDDYIETTIKNKVYRVYRPNHGLAHAVRKSALALDAFELLQNKNTAISRWLKSSLDPNAKSYNPNLAQQLAFAVLMLRTGRSSESNENYEEDSYKSAENFKKEAKQTGLFSPSPKDIGDFVFAIEAVGDPSKCYNFISDHEVYTPKRGCTKNRLNLRNFLYAVHHFDLRRIVSYDRLKIQKVIAELLGFYDKQDRPNPHDEVIQKLWKRAGLYLKATGDRDMDGTLKNDRYYKKNFFLLSLDPKALRKVIEDIQMTPIDDEDY